MNNITSIQRKKCKRTKIVPKTYHENFEKLTRKKSRQAYKKYSLNVFSRKQKLSVVIFKQKFRDRILTKLGC